MRLNNKITIKGDILKIFEEVDMHNGFEIGDFVKIDPNAAQQSGLDPNKPYEIQGFVDYGKGLSKSINAILDKELYKPHIYPPKGIISVKFITKEVSEGSFNPMKGGADKYSTIDKDVRGFIHVFAYPDPKGIETIDGLNQWETEDASNREVHFVGNFKEANAAANSFINEAIKQYLEEGEDDFDFDDENFSDPVIDGEDDRDDDYDDSIDVYSDEYEMFENMNEAKKEKSDPADKKKADKTNYGHKDMSDVDMVNPYELKKGIRIEMVDTEDYVKAMDKAVKKLKKDPMFYSNLIANSKQVKANKRSDLPKEVKDKKLNKTSDKMKDKANGMEVSKKDATKKNANDTLNKKEMAKGKPKGVKEMDKPGKETKAKLKESISIFNSLKKLLLS